MKKRNFFILLGLFLICCLAIVVVILIGQKKSARNLASHKLSPAEEYQSGETCFDSGNYADAYGAFKSAVQLAPENLEYRWRLARMALMLNDIPMARKHAKLVWEKGMRTPALVRTLVRLDPRQEDKKFEYAMGLLEQYPASPEKKELYGDVLGLLGKHAQAYDIWKSIGLETPSDTLVIKIARASFFLQKHKEATDYIQALWKKYQLGPGGFNILASLYIFSDKPARAEAIFSEAESHDWFDAYMQLKYAYFKLSRGETEAAEKILETLVQSIDSSANGKLMPAGHNARILLSFLWAMNSENRSRIGTLKALAEKDLNQAGSKIELSPWLNIMADARHLKGEILFHDFMAEKPEKPETAFKTMAEIISLIPDHPVVQLQYARECLASGRLEDGLKTFKQAEALPGFKKIEGVAGLFYQSPFFVLDLARTLALHKDTKKALRLLDWLHQKKMVTKASLKLFRDLSIIDNKTSQSLEAQEILETLYKDDRKIQLEGAAIAFTTGNLDKSLQVLDAMLAKEPDNQNLGLARIMVYLRNGDARRVLRECDKLQSSSALKAIIKARAYTALGSHDQADEQYRWALENDPTPDVMAEYAQYLLSVNNPGQAAQLFETVLKKAPDNHSALIGLSTIAISQNDIKQARRYLFKMTAARVPDIFIFMAQTKLALLDNNPEEAEMLARKVLELEPDHAEATYLRAMAIIQGAKKWQKDFEKQWAVKTAASILNKYLEGHPDNIMMLTGLLHVALVQEDFDKALALTERSLKLKPDLTLAFSKRFEIFMHLKQFDAAEKTLSDYQSNLAPSVRSTYLASLFYARGDAQKALDTLNTHLDDAAAALRWATYSILSNSDEGLEGVLSRHNYNDRTWAMLGTLALRNNNYKIANICYAEAIERSPENAAFLNNYAWSCIHLEQFDKTRALAAAEKATKLLYAQPAVKDTYAALLNKCGMFEETIKILEVESRDKSFPGSLLYRLAVAYENIGKSKDAASMYNRFLLSDKAQWPQNIEKKDVLSRIAMLKTSGN